MPLDLVRQTHIGSARDLLKSTHLSLLPCKVEARARTDIQCQGRFGYRWGHGYLWNALYARSVAGRRTPRAFEEE